ncbi:MAG: hypothetical protein DDT42_00450 [candidate division WS2 bacterium]|uniref:Uncharacterized protein n=1 Tax=Psychracetigena formicireducens TaxID=2986056 RepID=A0A9E2BFF2_PSYF1|nr:hypothetical protein [Candidatus Psychracetigena formicireducens]
MPYERIADIPPQVRTHQGVALTLTQANKWAEIFDALVAEGKVDSPAAVAWTSWKKLYRIENNKWVTRENVKGGEIKVNKFFSMIDLESIKLKERISEIELLKVGNWTHPEYGKLDITLEDLTLFVENFDNDVRRIELAIDAEHENKKGAAGWIKKLVIEGKEKLKALVEWTSWGEKLISQKIFKYISPEFQFEYTDAEKGKKFKNVLFGGALTNRPFLKGQPAVSLSENMLIIENGGGKMDTEKELQEALAKIKTLEEERDAKIEAEKKMPEKEEKKLEEEQAKQTITLTEHKILVEKTMALEKKLAEKDRDEVIRVAMEKGKITAKLRNEWANEYALKDPEGFKKFVEHQEVIVKLGEEGSEKDTEGKSVSQEISDRALEKIKKTEGLSFSAAVRTVLDENPELAKKF